ncbi:MAG: hypothetical protein ACT4P1_03230 [Sporichthyaceae bacterium]
MIDRVNRVLWTVLAVLLLSGGALGALASLGHVAGTDTDSPLLWDWAIERWRDAGVAAPLTVAGLGVLLVVLGVLLSRAQLPARRRQLETLQLGGPAQRGATSVRGGALPGALAEDLQRLDQVHAAQVSVHGGWEQATVALRLDIAAGTVVDSLAAAVRECLARFTATTGVQVRELEVTLHPQPEAVPSRVQ